jgi:hypothetical protein
LIEEPAAREKMISNLMRSSQSWRWRGGDAPPSILEEIKTDMKIWDIRALWLMFCAWPGRNSFQITGSPGGDVVNLGAITTSVHNGHMRTPAHFKQRVKRWTCSADIYLGRPRWDLADQFAAATRLNRDR